MKLADDVQGLYRRRRRGCTVRDPAAESSGDLVKRQFTVEGPHVDWAALGVAD